MQNTAVMPYYSVEEVGSIIMKDLRLPILTDTDYELRTF